MEYQKALPINWRLASIKECADFIRGVTFKANDKRTAPFQDSVVCFRTANIQEDLDTDDLIYVHKKFIKKTEQILQSSDILVSSANSIELLGKSCRVGSLSYQATLGGFITAARPKKEIIDADFFYYFFSSDFNRQLMQSFANKTTGIANLPIKKVQDIQLPLPSMKEQKKIVKKLDQLFTKIDEAVVLIEENLINVDLLFNSSVNDCFSRLREIKKAPLKNVTIKIGSGSTPNGGRRSYKDQGTAFIRSMNVHDAGFNKKGLVYLDDNQAWSLRNVAVEKNDILLNITGASVARCCLVDASILPARVNQHVSIIRVKENLIPRFVYYYLTSPNQKKSLLFQSAGGATREAITKKMIEEFEVPVPSLKVQKEVITKLDLMFKKTERQKQFLEDQLLQLRQFKASILNYTFEGKLVTAKVKQKTKQGQTFALLQGIAAIVEAYERTRYRFGEMVTAKYAFLLQHVFQVPLGIQFQNQSFGPYDKSIKKAVYAGIKQHYFAKDKHGALVLGDKASRILDVNYGLVTQVRDGMKQLTQYLKNATGHKVELLATVCKSIMDTGSTDFAVIKKHFEDWETPEQRFTTKANKFSDTEIKNCIKFVMSQDWDKKLVP